VAVRNIRQMSVCHAVYMLCKCVHCSGNVDFQTAFKSTFLIALFAYTDALFAYVYSELTWAF